MTTANISIKNPVETPGASTILTWMETITSGNVAAGAARVVFSNIGTINATVFGVNLFVGETVEFNVYMDHEQNKFVSPTIIPYTASATAMLHISITE